MMLLRTCPFCGTGVSRAQPTGRCIHLRDHVDMKPHVGILIFIAAFKRSNPPQLSHFIAKFSDFCKAFSSLPPCPPSLITSSDDFVSSLPGYGKMGALMSNCAVFPQRTRLTQLIKAGPQPEQHRKPVAG